MHIGKCILDIISFLIVFFFDILISFVGSISHISNYQLFTNFQRHTFRAASASNPDWL